MIPCGGVKLPRVSLVRLLLLFLLGCSLARGASTFLDAPFDRPDETALREMLRAASEGPPSAARELDLALAGLTLAGLLALEGKPHAARAAWSPVLSACARWEDERFERLQGDDRSRAQGLCALARAERLADFPSLFSWQESARLERDLSGLEAAPLPRDEQWYLEGRIFPMLPPGAGQDFRRAFVAWGFLTRARPELASPPFWLARTAQLARNEPRAESAYAESGRHVPPDPRTSLFHDGEKLVRRKEAVDGLRFGTAPQIFFAPETGLGAGLSIFDERVADRHRAALVSAWAATRGNLGARAALGDGDTIAGFRLAADVAVSDGGEDFFGLGSRAPRDALTRLVGTRTAITVALVEPFFDDFFLKVGWRGGHFAVRAQDGPATPPDADGRFHTGPVVAIGLDSRDSRFAPRRGVLASVEGWGPTAGLGSPRSFTAWRAEIEGHAPVGAGAVTLGACLDAVEDDAPFLAYPRVGRGCAVPGVRAGRFVDRKLLALSAEYERKLWRAISASVFVDAVAAGPDLDGIARGVWRWGGGGALTLSLSPYTRPRVRAELGIVGGELAFLVGAGASF